MITPALHNAFVKFGPLFRGDLIERTVYRETGNLPFSLSPSRYPPLSSRPLLLCPPLSVSSRDRFLEVVHNESVPLRRRRFVPTGARIIDVRIIDIRVRVFISLRKHRLSSYTLTL